MIAVIWSAVRVGIAARGVGDNPIAAVFALGAGAMLAAMDDWVAIFWKKGATVGVGIVAWLAGAALSEAQPAVSKQATP